jgi:hypothetical protein
MPHLINVQIEAPQGGADLSKGYVVMTFAVAKFERLMDRVAPALLLAIGLAPFGAMALLGA